MEANHEIRERSLMLLFFKVSTLQNMAFMYRFPLKTIASEWDGIRKQNKNR
jgi:hypothetical protein